jgi:hypothetical protein
LAWRKCKTRRKELEEKDDDSEQGNNFKNSIVKRDHVKQEKPGKTAMAGSYDLRLCAAFFVFSNKGFLKVCFLSFFQLYRIKRT